MEGNYSTPILFPVQLEVFLSQLRQLVREEIRLELRKNSVPTDEPLLTRQETAAFLKISLVTLHDWMKNRGLPFHRKRRGPRFLKSEVLRWFKGVKDKV